MNTFSDRLILIETAIPAHFTTFSDFHPEYPRNFWRGACLGGVSMWNSIDANRLGCRGESPDHEYLLEDHHPLDILKLDGRVVGASSFQPVKVYPARLHWLPACFMITR